MFSCLISKSIISKDPIIIIPTILLAIVIIITRKQQIRR
jgi:hypothetical protein